VTATTASEMAELLAKATPNWQVCICSIKGPCEHLPGFRVITDCHDAPAKPEDTEFAVAASRYDFAHAATLEAENKRLREALESARSMLVDLRDRHLNHTAAVVRAHVQHRIEAVDKALSQTEDKP
jgi:hypothetical protein